MTCECNSCGNKFDPDKLDKLAKSLGRKCPRCWSTRLVYAKKDFVLFKSAFAYESALNITHITLDGERTACGRTGWATNEGWDKNGPPCCLRCRVVYERLPESERTS